MNSMTYQAPVEPMGLARIERELAYFGARTNIETYAIKAVSSYPYQLWDVSDVDAGEVEDIERARVELRNSVVYLDSRGALRRPIPGYRQYVAFTQEAP